MMTETAVAVITQPEEFLLKIREEQDATELHHSAELKEREMLRFADLEELSSHQMIHHQVDQQDLHEELRQDQRQLRQVPEFVP